MEPYRVRVIYGDTDQMGVVYYANYLRYFEGARGHWIRQLGIPYAEFEQRGILLPVYEASIQYLRSAKYDDVLEVHLSQTHTRVKIRFEYKVHKVGSDEVMALGHTVHVCVNREGKPTRAPDWLMKALEAAGSAGGRAEPRSGAALEEGSKNG